MKKLLSVIFLASIVFYTNAQEVLENNPPSIKWSQINTEHFNVIFPRGFEEQGQRVANTLEHIYQPEAKSLGTLPKRISILLQNQSSISNGFVSILPRRSEFYAMPSHDYNFGGTNDWLDMLASHEYRHIVQYQHATRGFNKLFYYLFGGPTLAAMSSVAAPDWFWEGDAVATETAFTSGGRGKIPNFSRVFKTNLMEGRSFNYHKQYLRSFKHNIPDHYVLGYHMVSYLRKRTADPDVWSKVTARSWSVPFIPFAFSNAIKKETGMYVTTLYKSMAKDLRKEWQMQLDTVRLSDFKNLGPKRRRGYTDYSFPHHTKDGVIVLKQGIGDIDQFVILSDSKERRVFTPGVMNDSGMISVGGSVVVWNEYGFDPRWNVKNFSLIKAYDFNKKKKYVIGGKKGRYGSAAISPDATKIIAINTDTEYKNEIRIFSFPDGQMLKRFENPENIFYSMPRWSDDNQKIIVLKTTKAGRAVTLINFESGQMSDVIQASDENIGYPVLVGRYVLFNSPVNGTDNIYAFDTENNKRFKITSSKYGAYNPNVSADRQTLYYNDHTKDGLSVVSIPFDPSSWETVDLQPEIESSQYAHLVEQEGHPNFFKDVPQRNFPVRKFSKLQGLLNPYSWGMYVNNELTEANIGITSQDILSTTTVIAGYTYDINERTSAWTAGVSYQGWFPIIDVTASIANRSVTESLQDYDVSLDWKEQNLAVGARIPLITTSSRFLGNFSIGNSVGIKKVVDFENSVDGGGRIFDDNFLIDYADNGTLVYNEFKMDAYRLLKRSRRDINSKWGQGLDVKYISTPFGGNFQGGLFAVIGSVYLPGFFKHHSLWAYGAFQTDTKLRNASEFKQDDYLFQNEIPLPRGHSVSRHFTFYTVAVNYTLPIWYPDIALGPLLNIQRIRANGFYDYGYGEIKMYPRSTVYSSAGVEAKVDFNILRFLPQMNVGVRYSYLIETAEPKIEVLIGAINL
jgi:hypothetical protein